MLLLAALARLVSLDADVYFSDWIGHITDEGRWVETARNLTLFGDPQLYGLSRLHLLLSPGFQAVELALFKVFGVSIASARAFAAFSSVLLLLAWLLLWRSLSRDAWLLGAVVLGLDATLFSLSRVALPELPSLLFTQAAFLVLLFGHGGVRRAAAAGVLLLLAVLMKGTTLFMLPAFAAVAAGAAWHLPRRARLHAVLALLSPFMLCAALSIVGLLLFVAVDLHLLRTMVDQLSGFVHLVDGYGLFDRLFNAQPGTPMALLLGAWCASWAWPCRERWRDTPAGRLYLLSGLWAAGWLLVWGAMAYVPRRYMVHLSLPLLMHVLAGMSVMAAVGPAELARRLADVATRRPLSTALWLTLPSSYLVAMSLLELLPVVGWPSDRMSMRGLTFALVAMLLALGVARRVQRPVWVLAFALAPPLLAASWAASELLGALLGLIPTAAFERSWAYGAYAVLVVPIAAWLAHAAVHGAALRAPAAAGLVLAAGSLLSQQWPLWVQPTHLARDCSRRIAQQIPQAQPRIRSAKASAVFLETRLRYADQWTPQVTAEVIVQYFPDAERFQPPGAGYVELLRCPLAVHPRYRVSIDRPIEVVVYAHRDAAAALIERANER
jgi:hypothetical protein